MTSTQSYYYPSAPINMPRKPGYYPNPHHGAHSRMSVSPPEAADSVTTSGVASYDPSAASSSYAGSASDYESTPSSGASVDLYEYMNDRIGSSFDPTPLDRSLAQQAQTSGQLNAKTRELMDLQALAQSRLAAMQSSFASGMKSAKEVQKDLEWTQKRVTSINQRAARKYPKEYQMASQRYPAPVDC
ncbi:hypothetical protein K402DRAFT_336615 [Aulographum hederae CBS 113979]|uniref:Biogenesis of lysosome-related organelles complex 1 subunit KXD1 n=1 Tax=Aulographum hederae CBS 113979 TaxID=1176131 RepID=A0A6G1GU73_9PEZI|nr:hypothetical protein K402DRAFT_336615 [Aulographum hederae CBS 113979]